MRREGRHKGEEGVERSEEREGRHRACPYRNFEVVAALLLPQSRLRTSHGYAAAIGLRELSPIWGCTHRSPRGKSHSHWDSGLACEGRLQGTPLPHSGGLTRFCSKSMHCLGDSWGGSGATICTGVRIK